MGSPPSSPPLRNNSPVVASHLVPQLSRRHSRFTGLLFLFLGWLTCRASSCYVASKRLFIRPPLAFGAGPTSATPSPSVVPWRKPSPTRAACVLLALRSLSISHLRASSGSLARPRISVAKKVCKAASSSSSKLPGASPRPVSTANVEVSSAPSLGAPGKRFRRLCALRDTVGETVTDVKRDLDTLVTMIFPVHLAEQHRKEIVAFLKKGLRRSDFKNWQIPLVKSMAGENLKFGRNTYARQILQFPNKEAAEAFAGRPPIFYPLPHGPAVELKVYVDPAPEFTAAKARGETHIVIRNIPLGLTEEQLVGILLKGKNRDGQKWISELLHFHTASDPYEEMFQLQMHGIVKPMIGDEAFSVTPPVIWIDDVREPVLVNLSCHSCGICSSNHRTGDHHVFPTMRCNKINNPHSISVAQLQNVNSKALGHSPAANRIKQDLGLLFIGLDSEVEVWTCCACDFICGWTIDTALAHGDSPQHLRRLQTSGPLLKEEFGDLKAQEFLKKSDSLVQFLGEE
ncbi:unnamed protein product [Closterium sp. Naga37s-1]|nr:unnamed protein product [Closterium sp. Naga37s-1]